MGFGTDYGFANLRSYEGLRPKAHVIATHVRPGPLVFASGVTDCENCLYQCKLSINLNNPDPKIILHFNYGYFLLLYVRIAIMYTFHK